MLTIFALSFSVSTLNSCREDKSEQVEDSMEEAGDEIEDAADETTDEIEDAVDDN
jgi:cellobiose-specific phosphotransferase system component IIA